MEMDKRAEIDAALTKIRNAGTIIFETRNIAFADNVDSVLNKIEQDAKLSAFDWLTQYYDFIQAILYEVANVIELETEKIESNIYS